MAKIKSLFTPTPESPRLLSGDEWLSGSECRHPKDRRSSDGKEAAGPCRRSVTFFGLGAGLVLLSGCMWLVIGGIGAVGGYAVTRDTIQGEYDAGFDDAWKSAQSVCSTLGLIDNRDSTAGRIEATVDRAKVTVEVSQITPEAVRVKVKARHGIFPRLGTAEKVFVRIVQKLM